MEIKNVSLFWLVLVFLLMFLNWGLETVKWRILVRKILPDLNFWQAWGAVMAGLSLGLFTPNRIGEYAGRIFYLKPVKRVEVLLLTFIDRMCQMLVTIFFGSFGIVLFLFYSRQLTTYAFLPLLFFCGLLNVFLVILFLFPRDTTEFILDVFPSERLRNYIRHLRFYSRRDILRVMFYSTLRYFVFCLQYFFLFYAFGKTSYPISFLFIGISSVFLVKSIIPSLVLMELGIREAVALYFFPILLGESVKLVVLYGTLSVYFVNLVIPSLIGLAFIPYLKFFESER